MEIELLTTVGCHLCEEAEWMVRRAVPRARIQAVDVAEDDQLLEQWGERIPVLRYGERTLCWPFSLVDIRALVE